MACSKAGSIVALENEVWCSVEYGSADPRVLLGAEWYVSETWSHLPITTGQGLAIRPAAPHYHECIAVV
jgi:hypothetical protein